MSTALATEIGINRKALADGLAALGKLPGTRRLSLPAVGHVRITAENGVATLERTNFDAWASVTLPAEGEGEALLPHGLLTDLAGRLASTAAALELDGTRAVLRAGRFAQKLTGLPLDEWVARPPLEASASALLTPDGLRALAGVTYAASDQETRPILNGVFLHADEGRLAAVATNGHQLALRRGPVADELPEALISQSHLSFALGLLEKADEVRLLVGERRFVMESAAASVMGALIEGPYPHYRSVIPRGPKHRATFDRRDALAALRRLEPLLNRTPEGHIHRLTATFSVEEVVFSARNDTGEADEPLRLVAYEGEPAVIAFQLSYLIELLTVCTRDTVTLEFSGSDKPATIWTGDDALDLLLALRDA